jgi:oligosaccharyltransferase complex subunit epsilon
MSGVSLSGVWEEFLRNYDKTSTQVKLLDVFLVYVFLTGVVQFLYCAIVGTYPFNAFLGGFICSVGVFTVTVGLRQQVTNAPEFNGRNWAAAYRDYMLCCVMLFFVCVNFMG